MAQDIENPEQLSVASGATDTFPTVWTFERAEDVELSVDTGAGFVVQEQGVAYSVEAGDWLNAGADLVFQAGYRPVAEAKVLRRRVTLIRQAEAFGDLDSFRPAASEDAYDRLTRMMQEQAARLDRALVVAPGETPPAPGDGGGGVVDPEAIQAAVDEAVGPINEALGGKANASDLEDLLQVSGANAPDDAEPLREAIGTPSRAGAGVSPIPFKAHLRVWTYSPEDYVAEGAPCGDGEVDDVVALQAAIDAASLIKGARVVLRPDGHYRIIGADLTVKRCVYVEGQLSLPGVPGASNADVNLIWSQLGSRISIASNRTIRLKGSSGVLSAFTCRDGLNGQIVAHDSATRDAAFAGTHFTVEGEDTVLMGILSLGGDYVWKCIGYNRALLADIRWDAKNGFFSQYSLDVARGRNVHGWPYVTFGQLGNASSSAEHQDHRPGVAYDLAGSNDWIQLDGFFDYPHKIGFRINTAASGAGAGSAPLIVQLNNCGKDNLAFPPDPTPSLSKWVIPGSIGFQLLGGTDEIRIFGGTAAACDLAYDIQMTASQAQAVFVGSTCHGCRNGVRVNGGTVRMTGGWLRGLLGVYGVTDAATQGGTGIEVVSGQFISDRTLEVEKFTVAVDGNDVGGAFIGFPFIRDGGIAQVALHPVTVTGGGTAAPNVNFDQQILTGASTLGYLGQTRLGHVVQFYFDTTITVLTADNIKLNGGADLTCNIRDVLTLMDAGNCWVEVARGQAL